MVFIKFWTRRDLRPLYCVPMAVCYFMHYRPESEFSITQNKKSTKIDEFFVGTQLARNVVRSSCNFYYIYLKIKVKDKTVNFLDNVTNNFSKLKPRRKRQFFCVFLEFFQLL